MKRFAITILAVLISCLVALAFMTSQGGQQQADDPGLGNAPAATEVIEAEDDDLVDTQPGDGAGAEPDAQASDPERLPGDPAVATDLADATDASPAADQPAEATAPRDGGEAPFSFEGLRPLPAENPQLTELGGIDEASPFFMQAELTHWGAAIRRITLKDYKDSALGDDHYVIHSRAVVNGQVKAYPFAALAILIEGKRVSLEAAAWSLEEHDDTRAAYSITIVNGDDQPVVDIRRVYTMAEGSFDLACQQRVINRSGQPITIIWQQNAQSDVPPDKVSYLGDRRQMATGYFDPDYDARHVVYARESLLSRDEVIEASLNDDQIVWPSDELPESAQLVWVANLNRYFAAVTHRPTVEAKGENDEQIAQRLDTVYPELGVYALARGGGDGYNSVPIITRLASRPVLLKENQAANLDLSLFTGPRDPKLFAGQPYAALGLDSLIIYNLGCFCTSQWLAKGLLGFLDFLHNHIVFDWALAIIVLVLIVRLLLHPITKKFQVKSMIVGKKMAALQPELAKLKEKYADDTQKLSQEQMRLWRERGINPAAMAGYGCVPALLQMPIWIALYAMLYLAIELRHESAFFGVFQKLSGGEWQFLADLSAPDRFITFFDQPQLINLPIIMLDYSSLNILPLAMGVFFFWQQKLMSPPAATEEQKSQQKVMRWMMAFFMPVIMYSVPSGLTLYILASSCAGTVDSLMVRRSVKKAEERGELDKVNKAKPGSLGHRISKYIESAMEQAQAAQQKGEGGGPQAPRGPQPKDKGKGNNPQRVDIKRRKRK